ncbi:Polysaccharide deacetylase [Streptomyces misionensis]|uniref:Polysaccharide deacetylase n=1 Tax=Streptomyces misionensis TaxID=67331 RepID=A0A1H5AJY9_9ACTN|nr:Polysaccharide deacetylase [Streptomyces misionensis]
MSRPGEGRRAVRERRGPGRAAAGAVALCSLLLLVGCAQSVDPIERLGRKAAEGVHPHAPASVQPYRRWGLTAPLARPPVPAARPLAARTGPTPLPPVVDHVPTRDRVVFLTYDDAGRDPGFTAMVRQLRLPVSLFVPDGTRPDDLARLRAAGAAVENRAPDRPPLAGRPYTVQRAAICARRDRLRARLFRPPGGAYDRTTRRAAAGCGITVLTLWRAALTPAGLTYPRGPRHLRPGDIVRVTPGAPASRLLRGLQRRNLTVGRLEDYL